ncbi:MAG: hypothetical protein HZB86_10295 [Deltaproteobacteria bacterium]|nr:hypothetical protein [Deltaproteobacteria bacterium]
MAGIRRTRPGSRLLLGAALFFGTLAAMFAGAMLAEALLDLFGVGSAAVRLGGKVLAMACALPAGFYLVERWFIRRSSRGEGEEDVTGK